MIQKTIITLVAIIAILLGIVDAPAKNNFLWEVENEDTKMYLLGSIHLMPEDTYPLDEKIESCFQEADVLAVEADPSQIDQTAVQTLIMSKGMYPQGETLRANIDSVLYKKVTDVFTAYGLPMQQVDTFKPWFASFNIAVLEIQKTKLNPEFGIDNHFIKKAKSSEMEIIELESGFGQLELLTSFPEKAQEQYLEYSLSNYENIQELFDTMLAAWKTGDAELMNKATKQKMLDFCKTMPGLEGYYNKMFPERDNKIVEKLDKILKSKEKKTYFVVVGAGHLIGDDGLLQLLKDKGYKTKQL